MLDKILVPIDSIEWDNTLHAVEVALSLAMGNEAGDGPKVIFLHVLPSEPRISMTDRDSLAKLKKRKLKGEFEKVCAMCGSRNFENFETLIEEGEVHEKIIETALNKDVDLIVMGSGRLHDRTTKGKIRKFFYGSVTEKVIHGTSCTVFIARA